MYDNFRDWPPKPTVIISGAIGIAYRPVKKELYISIVGYGVDIYFNDGHNYKWATIWHQVTYRARAVNDP